MKLGSVNMFGGQSGALERTVGTSSGGTNEKTFNTQRLVATEYTKILF